MKKKTVQVKIIWRYDSFLEIFSVIWSSERKNEKAEEKIDMRMAVEACIQCETNLRIFINAEYYQLLAVESHIPLAVTKYGLHICLTEN